MNKKTIGIVGGGQLGRMLTDAAHGLGFKVVVLDPTPNSPAGQVADQQIVSGFKDREKILELAKVSDYLTVELEGVNDEALDEVIKDGKPVNPDPKILRIIRDKFAQKTFLSSHDIPTAEFALVENVVDAEKQGEIFGFPFLLKARFDAYDGRGNFLVQSKDQIPEAFEKLKSSPLYAEKFVPFIRELSIVSARDTFGTVISYPMVETIHKNNICHIVKSPANVNSEIKMKGENLASRVLEVLAGVGVFGIEMFLTDDGNLFINEIAPRVHNSGHHTIEAFSASQFEQHIRAITGMELAQPKPQAKHAVMINILGERQGEAKPEGLERAESLGDVKVHIYGKIEAKPERKMGHITALASSEEEAEEKAKTARRMLRI